MHSHSLKVALLVELLPLPSSPTTGSGLAYQPLLVATTHLACGEELEEQRLAQADGLENPHGIYLPSRIPSTTRACCMFETWNPLIKLYLWLLLGGVVGRERRDTCWNCVCFPIVMLVFGGCKGKGKGKKIHTKLWLFIEKIWRLPGIYEIYEKLW